MNRVTPLDLRPRVLLHLDRDGHDLLPASAIFENVQVSAVPRFVLGRHAHADRLCPVFTNRTPVCLIADWTWTPAFDPHQFLRRGSLPLFKLILRHCPFEGAILWFEGAILPLRRRRIRAVLQILHAAPCLAGGRARLLRSDFVAWACLLRFPLSSFQSLEPHRFPHRSPCDLLVLTSPQRLCQTVKRVGDDHHVTHTARQRHARHAPVDQHVGGPRVDVDDLPLGRLPLRQIAGDGITEIEVAERLCVYRNRALLRLYREPPAFDLLDRREFPVHRLAPERPAELDAVADREIPLRLPKHFHTVEPPRVIGHTATIIELDRQSVLLEVLGRDAPVFAFPDSEDGASLAIAHHILIRLVARGPLPVSGRHVVSIRQNRGRMILRIHRPFLLEHSVDHRVCKDPLAVSWNHRQVTFRLSDIPLGQRHYPVALVADFDNPPLLMKQLDRFAKLPFLKQLDRPPVTRLLLPHDLLDPHRLDLRLCLKLLERRAGFHRLVLVPISDQQNALFFPQSFEQRIDPPGV